MNIESAHVVSFEWKDLLPNLTIYDGKNLMDISLSRLRFIDLSASKGIWCVGSFEGEEYIPCPNNVITDGFRQCEECAKAFIPVLECIFEPRCDGSLCNIEFCSRSHVVYLAFFGSLSKVGMTSLQRLRRRAIEQGADAYAAIKELPNRLAARNFEKHISNTYGIPQSHSSGQILSRFSKVIDRDGIKTAYTEKILEMRKEVDRMPELIFLDDYPIEIPIRRPPVLRPTATRHRGSVLGIKGKYMIYEHSGIYALNVSDLVGRKIQGVLGYT